MSLMLTTWFKGLGMNDYIYTERMGIPCIEYTGKHHARITKDLTSEEFDSFVEFKTMQHNQSQAFLMNITKGRSNHVNMDGWIDVSEKLPVNSVDAPSGDVYGWIAPYGIVKSGVAELVHFDGSDWYDQDSRTCTVTHWKKL